MTTSMYARSGVNVALGDRFSAFAASVCRRTWKNSPYVVVHDHAEGYFRGPRSYEFIGLPEGSMMDGGMDGVGTKTGIIAQALSPRTAGYDLLAMTAMDRTRCGPRVRRGHPPRRAFRACGRRRGASRSVLRGVGVLRRSDPWLGRIHKTAPARLTHGAVCTKKKRPGATRAF